MKNKEKVSEYNKKYYQDNKEQLLPKLRALSNKWCKENKERRNEQDRERRKNGNETNKKATRKFRLKLKKECIEAYGGRCSCCGESNLDMLTIDHIFENGAEHRKTFTPGGGSIHTKLKKEGFPQDIYQCLCFNCNYSKYLNGGTCSHIKEQNNL